MCGEEDAAKLWQDEHQVTDLPNDAHMDLRNAHIFDALQLIPLELIFKAVEKSSCALHDEAICKAVSFDKQPPQPLRKSKPQS